MSNNKQVLDKIEEQLQFYKEHSDKIQIPELLRMQDVMSINSYYLASQLDLSNKGSVEADLAKRYKVIHGYLYAKIEDKSITDKMAQHTADKWAEEEFKLKVRLQTETYWLDIKLKQINRVLSSIQQRISYLKAEFNNKN